MTTSAPHYPLLHTFVSDLNCHINTHESNITHPTMTCATVYEHLITSKAPEHFHSNHHSYIYSTSYKTKNKHKNKNKNTSTIRNANISSLSLLNNALDHTQQYEDLDQLPLSNDTSDTDDLSNLPKDTVPYIAVFQRSGNIICDACGGRGHHANHCFKRDPKFLPQYTQRCIAAYNAKYGDIPLTDNSPPAITIILCS